MSEEMPSRWARAVIATVSVIVAGAASAQVDLLVPEPLELNIQLLDLTFPVEDISLQVRETSSEIRIELPADILFDFDKDEIRPAAIPAMRQAADIIRRAGGSRVHIEGHTDAKGNDGYNQKLSERRAAAVKAWLTSAGRLPTVAFDAAGFGAKRPVAPNKHPDGSDDPDGRQKNRRVEIIVKKS